MIKNGTISELDIKHILDDTYASSKRNIDNIIISALFDCYPKSGILLHENCKFVHRIKLCKHAIRMFGDSLDKFSYFCRHIFDNDIDMFNEFWDTVFVKNELIDDIEGSISELIVKKSIIDLKKIYIDKSILQYEKLEYED